MNPPPPYQNTPNQQFYNSAADLDARDDNERNNLLSAQHSNYGSVSKPRKPYTTKRLLGYSLIIGISLFVAATYFYPTIQAHWHNKIRREWEAEEREHQALRDAWNAELKAMVMEREQWRKERADHENRRQREEEEKRALIVWDNLTPSNKCLRYGTREYSATLAHIPLGLDPLKECWKKSIDIHGRQILPSRCDTQVCLFLSLHCPILDSFLFFLF